MCDFVFFFRSPLVLACGGISAFLPPFDESSCQAFDGKNTHIDELILCLDEMFCSPTQADKNPKPVLLREWFVEPMVVTTIIARRVVTYPYPGSSGQTQRILETRPQEWFLVLTSSKKITWLPLFAFVNVAEPIAKFYGMSLSSHRHFRFRFRFRFRRIAVVVLVYHV